MSFVTLGIPYFANPSKGVPVFNGFIYVGLPDTDPEVVVNQIAVTLVQEDGTEVAASQPIRTGAGGVPLYNGSPVQLKVATGSYSLKVNNSLGAQVYYVPDGQALIAEVSATPLSGAGIDWDALQEIKTSGYPVIWDAATVIPEADKIAMWDGMPYEDVRKYGATGDGVTDDTVAIQAALDSGGEFIFFPEGNYRISKLVIPSTIKKFMGAGAGTVFTVIGTVVNYEAMLQFNSLVRFDVSGFKVDVDNVAYATTIALQFTSCSYGRIKDIEIVDGGFYALSGVSCTRVSVSDITINDFNTAGIYFTSAQEITIDKIKCYGSGTYHSIQVYGGAGHIITNCQVTNNGTTNTGFCISVWEVVDTIVSNNICTTSYVEGINAQDSTAVTIIDNIITCDTAHADFGLSIYGQFIPVSRCIISGNKIYFSGKSGIALASSPSYDCRLNVVTNNFIVSPNQLNEAHGAGILLYGSSLCTFNEVSNNSCLDEGATMYYGVSEYDDGAGAPTYNRLINNNVITASGLLKQQNTVSATSKSWEVAQETWTPVVSSDTGTITSYTIQTAQGKRVGNYFEFDLQITITNAGTGGGGLSITLPYAMASLGSISGREAAVTGYSLTGTIGTTTAAIFYYNNTTCIATGAVHKLSGRAILA